MAGTHFIARQTPITADWLNDVNALVYGSGVSILNVRSMGAVGDGMTDDTTAIQSALTSGAMFVLIPPGYTFLVTSLTLSVGQTLLIQGTLSKKSGGTNLILMATKSSIIGPGRIVGNSVTSDCIVASGSSELHVQGITISGFTGKGVSFYANCSKYIINNNSIYNLTGAAINVEYSTMGIISGNIVDAAHDGVLFYGGDANVSTTIGSSGLVISDNVIQNIVWGGIWGTLTQDVSVTNNYTKSCADVGIDFEGCMDFTCTGNTVIEGGNACYSCFFGSSNGTFTGNSAKNVTSTGAGFYFTTNASYTNTGLSVVGNTVTTKTFCILTTSNAGRALYRSIIANNTLTSTGGYPTIELQEVSNISIQGNVSTTSNSAVGFFLSGVTASSVCNNTLYGFGSTGTVPATSGGIRLFGESTTYPSQSNAVRCNSVYSYAYSIVDNCTTPGVTYSKNKIDFNAVGAIYRSVGATYNGVVTNNTDVYDPNVAVAAQTF